MKNKPLMLLGIIIALLGLLSCDDIFDFSRNYTAGAGSIYPGSNIYSVYVSDNGTVGRVISVTLSGLTYPSAGDLKISLISPSGTGVTLVDQEGSTNNFNGNYKFVSRYDSTGIDHLVDYMGDIVPDETYQADSSFDALTDENIHGNWELRIYNYGGDTNALISWTLKMEWDESYDNNIP